MAGVSSEESGPGRSLEGVSSGQQQRCQSGEALAEWRSSEQVENESPSTSPPYWDSGDDDDGGPKPCDLYGKYTWKIDKFSQINKRELRSNAFEVGGYKWYILIYPQGCDVCNHLSLFLCVANHDKLLPGWSHFAQFTIAVVNKDPKKSKYSDTLHRFWKKEHDWGWKKFMELQKVLDGFIDADTLIIKAQVQVIRERADRPFRCLDCQYRRELVRVYLTNVEQICRRFVEERRSKLGKLIDDKARWSSFCAFWLGMDRSSRRRMSREITESILKVVVKHFFIEKEVTSTLVMDSLYSGLKALEGHNKGKKSKGKYLEAAEESPVPIIRVENDTFVLVDDVLLLLERAAIEPLPPKDEKGPQNRTKDGTTGEEFNKDSIERDERRLTELGRRTIEIFVLAHIFSKIEVAYQEAVALKKQEELIREEEAAWLAEVEQKARRGAADKEKKSKKKQGKQKRNNRKGKDKGRDDKSISIEQEKIELEQDRPSAERKDVAAELEMTLEKSEVVEDVSDVSDSVDGVPEIRDFEDRDVGPINWDTDPPSSSGVSVQNGTERRSPSKVDDSSSTCSSDSVPSAVINSPNKRNNSRHQKNQKSPSRGKNHQRKLTSDTTYWVNEEPIQLSAAVRDARHQNGAFRSSPSQTAVRLFQDRVVNGTETQVGKKDEETTVRSNFSVKDVADVDRAAPPRSPSKTIQSTVQPKICHNDPLTVKKQSPIENASTSKPAERRESNVANEKLPARVIPITTEKPSIPPTPIMSRPLSAPLVPGPRPNSISTVGPTLQPPVLARSVSAAGRLGPESSPSTTQSYIPPQSYRNAIVGGPVTATSSSYSYSQAGPTMFSPHNSERMDVSANNPIKPSLSFGMMSQHHDMLQNGGTLWMDRHPQRNGTMQSFDLYNPVVQSTRLQDHRPSQFPACTSGRQSHVALPDEFPHLDIINDLLEDNSGYPSFGNGAHNLNRHYSFPGEPAMSNSLGQSCRFDRSRSYHDDGVQHGYGAPGRSYDALRDMTPQSGPRPYVNGQIDGFARNQWQMGGSDLQYFGVRNNMEGDGYPYNVPDYANNLNVGMNGYSMFRPSNGL